MDPVNRCVEYWQAPERTQCGACRGGGMERRVPRPPAQDIKDAAAGWHTELQPRSSHQPLLSNNWDWDLVVKTCLKKFFSSKKHTSEQLKLYWVRQSYPNLRLFHSGVVQMLEW